MARYPAWAVFVLTAALVAGCEPAKELPTDVPKSDGATTLQQLLPVKSEPEAKDVIDRAVKSLTGGKPEMLAKLKASRCVLKGQSFENPELPTEVTRTVAAVWPDRLYAMDDRQALNTKNIVEAWLRRPDMSISANGVPQPHANPAEREHIFASDEVAQHWLALLLPASDPKAVVFDHESIEFERRVLNLVKVSLADYPVYQLTFDGKTDALVRVEYTVSEFGVARRTKVTYSSYKPGPNGLMLPHLYECWHNGTVVEKLAIEKWEFPAEIKDEEFSPKK